MCWKKYSVLDSETTIIKNWHIPYTDMEESFIEVRWFPPKEKGIKFNFDGSYRGGNVVDCGGIFRDSDGKFLMGFSFNSQGNNALMAEAKSLYFGSKFFRRFNSPLIVEDDSLSLIKMAKKEWECPWYLSNFLEDIW